MPRVPALDGVLGVGPLKAAWLIGPVEQSLEDLAQEIRENKGLLGQKK